MEQPVVKPQPKGGWGDFILYLVVGFVAFLGLSSLVGALFLDNLTSPWFTFAIGAANFGAFAGTTLLFGAARGKLSLPEIGFLPPRLPGAWLLIGSVVALLLLPIRGAIGIVFQLLLEGDFESIEARSELLSSAGATLPAFLLTFIGIAVLVPIAEELFFRGLLHTWLRQRLSFRPATVISSTIFGLAHFDSLGVVVASFIFALVAAYIFERCQSLWVPIAMHAVTNGTAVVLLYLALWLEPMLPETTVGMLLPLF